MEITKEILKDYILNKVYNIQSICKWTTNDTLISVVYKDREDFMIGVDISFENLHRFIRNTKIDIILDWR